MSWAQRMQYLENRLAAANVLAEAAQRLLAEPKLNGLGNDLDGVMPEWQGVDESLGVLEGALDRWKSVT